MFTRIDKVADRLTERIRNTWTDRFFYMLSRAADHGVLWLVIGAIYAFATQDAWFFVKFAIALGVESGFTNGVIKSITRRHRPELRPNEELPYRLHRPITTAFPSGHATSAFTAAIVLATSPASWIFYLMLASLVAFSRIYVRLHHATDVLGGITLGIGFGLLARWFVR